MRELGLGVLCLSVLLGACEPTFVAAPRGNPSGRPAPTSRPTGPTGRDGGTTGPGTSSPGGGPGTAPAPRPDAGAPSGADECARLGYHGECASGVARWCQDGRVQEKNCQAEGRGCGFVSDSIGYYCTAAGAAPTGDAGMPAPTGDAGSGTSGDPLGACDGTTAQCESARLINAYRTSHMAESNPPGECGHSLRWDSNLGRMAQMHQDSMGMSIGHSSYGYPENVGSWFTAGDYAGAVDWIASYDPGAGEGHCNSDGSYVASHHCNTMFCNHRTVGVGVVEQAGGQMAMTMIFGDESGQPSW